MELLSRQKATVIYLIIFDVYALRTNVEILLMQRSHCLYTDKSRDNLDETILQKWVETNLLHPYETEMTYYLTISIHISELPIIVMQ